VPEVTAVTRSGDQIVVTGKGNVLQGVVSFLTDSQVIAEQLHVDRVTLDDAFLALTGRSIDLESN
jgi:ABC-2 type transport system ATP-binding protein